MRFAIAVDGGQLPLDNHHNENQIRPIAVGRNNPCTATSVPYPQKSGGSETKRL